MISLKEYHLLNERADFQYVASELVKYYKLKSKVKFGSINQGDYDFDNDVIKTLLNIVYMKCLLVFRSWLMSVNNISQFLISFIYLKILV